jgi:hypothetical protein
LLIVGGMVSKRWLESKGRMSVPGMPVRRSRTAEDFT